MTTARLRLVPAALLALVLLTARTPVAAASAEVVAVGPTQIIVGWRSAVASARAQGELETRGFPLAERLYGGRAGLVDVPEGTSAEAFAGQVAALPGVEYAEPDYPISIAWVPNDPYYNATPPSLHQWGPKRIGAEVAWDVSRGNGTTIAIIDTGVDLDHPDLAAHLDTVNDRDFVNNDYEAQDDNGHGTHCAGIAAAVSDNATGVAGMAPEARILPIKTLDAAGNGTTALLADGINYAVAKGADVVSMSLGGPDGSITLANAMRNAELAGVLVVAASGNGNTAVYYPAAYPEAMAVGATDGGDVRTSYSNKGVELDVMAPGGTSAAGVLSTIIDGYGLKYGTSMATPHVAGAAALLKSAYPATSSQRLADALSASAHDLGSAGFDALNGYGLVRADLALGYLGSTDTMNPTVASDVQPVYADSATITFVADDGPWNVEHVGFTLDGGSQQFGFTLMTSAIGTHTVEFYAEDFAGNRSGVESAIFRIDDTLAPITRSDARPVYYGGSAAIALQATDGSGSGVAQTRWSLDGSPATSGTLVSTSVVGDHLLEFSSTDLVGNREATHTAEFRVYGTPDVQRIAAADRYSTAIALSQSTFPNGSVPAVVLASGEDFPDALTASGLAGAMGAPVLLTPRTRVPGGLLAELDRLGATRVVIVGGAAAVEPAVAAALGAHGLKVERIAGSDRYATAVVVAERMRVLAGVPPGGVFLARGDLYADALALSPLAYRSGYPVLLTRRASLPAETDLAVRTLGASRVILAGGPAAVSAAVQTQVAATSHLPVVRIAGANRYATAAAVATFGLDEGLVSGPYIGVVTGTAFPDALSGGAVTGAHDGVLLLTKPTGLPAEARAVVAARGRAGAPVRVFGGVSAVSASVLAALAGIPVL